MVNMNPIGSIEHMWSSLITSSRFPNELNRIMPGSRNIEIDARQVGPVILNKQSLHDLQAHKKDLLSIAEPIMKELAGIIQKDYFIVLCDSHGTIILANNVLLGRVCPGVVADDEGIIHRSLQKRCLSELTIYCDDEKCIGGYFNSVIFPIHDNQNEIQAILSMVSYDRGISEELRLAVFLGASLIETRFQYWQVLKEYSDSLIGALPDIALLINERGCIESVNENFTDLIGIDNTNLIIGRPFEKIVRVRDKSFSGRIRIQDNMPLTLNVAGDKVACTVLNNRIIPGPFGAMQLLLMKESLHNINIVKSSDTDSARLVGFDQMVGNAPQLISVKELGKKAAKSGFAVFISGESGTGKELLAEAIHIESGRSGPFIPINCGAIPRELLQSELFGYIDGSFTGGQKGGRKGNLASADGGTVFLDEIGEMPLEMQVSLLRFLQDKVVTRIGEDYGKKVDVRIISATNRNLLDEVHKNQFRLDLYYRLNEINIHMPPLRDRQEDIPLLITYMLKNICDEQQITVPEIDEAAVRFLCNYDWPGNCRELQNVLKSALIYMSDNLITAETLKQFLKPEGMLNSSGDSLQDIEKNTIINRLMSYEGNISKAADSLNINRSTLYRKVKYYDIQL